MDFVVNISSQHDSEIHALQERLGGTELGDLGILGLELLEVVSRHLEEPGAQIWLKAPGGPASIVDVSAILAEMKR